MKKLLELVRHHVAAGQVNITLKFTLSALWNLTDESPSTCSVFLNEGGMALFLLVLGTVFLIRRPGVQCCEGVAELNVRAGGPRTSSTKTTK